MTNADARKNRRRSLMERLRRDQADRIPLAWPRGSRSRRRGEKGRQPCWTDGHYPCAGGPPATAARPRAAAGKAPGETPGARGRDGRTPRPALLQDDEHDAAILRAALLGLVRR